jgi:galactokinase/galacturonokinase
MALEAHTLLAFVPSDDGRVRLESDNFEGAVAFDVRAPMAPGPASSPEWGAYARGAAQIFADLVPGAVRGFDGRLVGTLPGGGLSSSASVLLAYLAALAATNERTLSPGELVRAARRVENECVGVASGILDPASIVGARRGELLCIDTKDESWASSPLGAGGARPAILVAFTGIARRLVHSGFNDRVGECHLAAEALLDAAGCPRPEGRRARLGDLDDGSFERFGEALPEALALRARHFFGERRRVREGLACWQRGDLAGFGAHMNASCESSIHNYQTGSPELVALQAVLVATPGVIGARFSGAGFGGCSIALVEREAAGAAAAHVREGFARAHPELRERMRVFVVDSDEGLRIESPFGGASS